MEQEEFEQLVQEVSDRLENKSSDPSQFELATSLTGISSLPVLYQNGEEWTLKRVLISLLKGADGKEVEFGVSETHLTWRYVGGTWYNLISREALLQPAADIVAQLTDALNDAQTELQNIGTEWNVMSSDVAGAIQDAETAADNVKDGEDGKTPVISIGTTTTLAAGSNALVESSSGGTDASGNPITNFNFGIPRGDTGKPLLVNSTTGNYEYWDESINDYVDSGLPAYAYSDEDVIIDNFDDLEENKEYVMRYLGGATFELVEPSENFDIGNSTPSFTEAEARVNIATGESISTLFGKIAKYFADLGTLAFKSSVSWATEITGIPSWIGTSKPTYDYSEISGTPTIPTNVSDLTNDNDYQTETEVDNKISAAVSSVYKYVGSVSTYANLPTGVTVIGHVYNIVDTGDNYAWVGSGNGENGDGWDKLGASVDLSSYYTSLQVDTLLSDKQDVSSALTLGTTSSTAFRGDYGNTLYTERVWLRSHIVQTTGAIDCSTGKSFTITASDALALSLSNLSSIPQGETVIIYVLSDSTTARTITLPTTGVVNQTGLTTADVTDVNTLELNIYRFGSTYIMKGVHYVE